MLDFVLEYPRRCSTHLFPAKKTWSLTGIVVTMICVDMLCVQLSSYGNADFASLST